jgi:hypothetical protein
MLFHQWTWISQSMAYKTLWYPTSCMRPRPSQLAIAKSLCSKRRLVDTSFLACCFVFHMLRQASLVSTFLALTYLHTPRHIWLSQSLDCSGQIQTHYLNSLYFAIETESWSNRSKPWARLAKPAQLALKPNQPQVGLGSHGTNSQNWSHEDFNWNRSSCSKINPLLAVSKL